MAALNDILQRISTQLEELRIEVAEIKETITKQRNDALLDRLNKLEGMMRDQHIALDALNAIDINPTIEAQRPNQVKVAGRKKKDEAEKTDKEDKKDDKADKAEEEKPEEEPLQFATIVEYWKHIWVVDRARIYEKGAYSEKEYDEFCEKNKETLEKDKKKKNDLLLQKGVAFKIWRTLSDDRKDIVKAMKAQSANDVNKKASKDVEAEE